MRRCSNLDAFTERYRKRIAGYEDPLLLAAAQAESKLYYLSPWLYTPSLALTFPTEDYPVKYFEAGRFGCGMSLMCTPPV